MVLMTEEWKNSRCGCCNVSEDGDASLYNCLMGCFCPLPWRSRAAAKAYHPQHKTNVADCCFLCCCGGYSSGTYTLFRLGYHIKGDACSDCLYYTYCPPLPSIQMANESDCRMTRPYSFLNRNQVEKEWVEETYTFEKDLCGVLYGCCCPGCAFADVAHMYGKIGWCYALLCMNPAVMRFDMRHEYNIGGSCYSDIVATFCCPGFAYTQMKKEVEMKGAVFGTVDYGESTYMSQTYTYDQNSSSPLVGYDARSYDAPQQQWDYYQQKNQQEGIYEDGEKYTEKCTEKYTEITHLE